MYVAMVRVGKLERSAEWAVCWTDTTVVNDEGAYVCNVRLWGSVSDAAKHRESIIALGRAAHVISMPVYRGTEDRIWIDPNHAARMTVSELSAGWYYRSCYEVLIGDEARKMCDQTQDDVHTEASARP